MRALSVALVHHPVLSKSGDATTSAITNLDVHDIARTARTYGCARFYLVHPIAAQRELVHKICEHWTTGSSAERIPTRKIALELCEATASLEDMYTALGGRENIEVWATAARAARPPLGYDAARISLQTTGKPVVLLLGTSWGLPPAIIDSADALLPSIGAAVDSGFRHLSVRAACAITLDRLLGPGA
jgi:hypothetical protein